MMKLFSILVVLLVAVIGIQGNTLGANVLPNPSFTARAPEQVAIGVGEGYVPETSGWTWSGGSSGSAFYEVDTVRTGPHSAKLLLWGTLASNYAYTCKAFYDPSLGVSAPYSTLPVNTPMRLGGYFRRAGGGSTPMLGPMTGKLKVSWIYDIDPANPDDDDFVRNDFSSVTFDTSYAPDTWHWLEFTTPGPPSGVNKVVATITMNANVAYGPYDAGYYIDDMVFEPIPEPTSLLLLGSGLVGLLGLTKRKKT